MSDVFTAALEDDAPRTVQAVVADETCVLVDRPKACSFLWWLLSCRSNFCACCVYPKLRVSCLSRPMSMLIRFWLLRKLILP